MIIRRGTPAGRDAIFAFTNSLSLRGGVDRAVFDPVFDAALGSDNSVVLIAEDDDASPVGYLLGTVAPMFVYGGGMAFVQELFVAEPQRRSGVGSALMAEFTSVAVARNATVVALATSRAGSFYEALGFSGGATYFTRPITT